MAENRTVKVVLKAEIASYVANFLRATEVTDKLGASTTSAASDIERALAQTEKAANSSSQTFDRLGNVTKKSFAAIALAVGGFGAALLVQGTNANSFAEQNEIALTTMLGSANAAKAALDEVYNLATETPFQFPSLTEQHKVFVSSRMELSKIIPLMHAYSSTVAALGGDGATLDQVADAFAKMQALGKADADQLNSLALAGIPVWQYLADEAGTTVDQVREDVSRNLYDADRAVTVLTAAMEKQFGGMLDGMSDSYARWQDRLSSATRRSAQALAEPLMTVGMEILKSLTGLFNEATTQMQGADWSPVLEPLKVIPETIDRFRERLEAGGIEGVIQGVGTALDLLAAASELVVNAALPLVDVIGIAVNAGMPLVDVVTMLLEGFNSLPAPVQAGFAALALISTLHGPYAKLVEQVVGWTAATRAAMAEQIRYQQVLHTGSVLNGTASASVSRLSLAWGAARTSLTGFSTAVRGAGSALMSAFGGPVGIAVSAVLAAATIATAVWTDAQQRAEEAARANKDAINSVSDALDRNTGAFTENAKRQVTDQLLDKGLSDQLSKAGVSLADFSDALYGNRDAQEAFRQKLIDIASTDAMRKQIESTGKSLEELGRGFNDVPSDMVSNIIGSEAVAAARSLAMFDSQVENNKASLERFQEQASLTAGSLNMSGTVTVDTSQAEAALSNIQQSAQRALSSFINSTPQKKKSGGGGGGGSARSGDSPEVKALKAEQKEIKKRAEAEKKAANEYEKLMRERSQAAEKAAREAEDAARDAADSEASALDKVARATDMYVSAQRQRAAIERTLAAETDPVRQQQLRQALADAIQHESDMLAAKTAAEREAATATSTNTAAQAEANRTVKEASTAQAEYEAASQRAAEVQEASTARIEAAAERLAAATEAAAERSSGAMSGASEDAVESLQEWIDRMNQQIQEQEDWVDNMLWLAQNASAGVVGQFASMGKDGAAYLAELRANGGQELGQLEALAARSADGTRENLLQGLLLTEQIYPDIVARFGRKAADELVAAVSSGRVKTDDIMTALKTTYNGQTWQVNVDAKTSAAISQANSVVSWIESQRPSMTLTLNGRYDHNQVKGFADGGALEGPGPKGKDSFYIKAAPGEHMLSASDVDAMGGQSGVYAFRRALHAQSPRDISGAVAGAAASPSSGVQIKQTIYYPIAEPASKAAIRSARNEVS